MALRGHQIDIFTPEWVNALKGSPESGMAAEIQVYSRGEVVYNAELNEYTTEETVHYSGKARVQPIRMEVQTYQVRNPTSIQNIRVQIPIDADFDVRRAMVGRVTAAPRYEVPTRYSSNVPKVADSSSPFERTFQSTIDQEVRHKG